ncbi:DUF2273 domain-containing protein [Arthrobacter glacialis]|uniref:DUF2273 domain-containing protein n=1 Tax=Arthrobacter glacialis TaxID=1664 RepID=UPI000CD44561|nr:DUF2273 domain-containing protein [Arthrobacter glacialis]POH61200.1 hypothetical protein CVS28_01510 [Arthrobacter glacialis]
MTPAQTGTAVAAVLAISALSFGFWAMLLVAIFMVIGAVVGGAVAGRSLGRTVDLRGVVDALRGKRTSS